MAWTRSERENLKREMEAILARRDPDVAVEFVADQEPPAWMLDALDRAAAKATPEQTPMVFAFLPSRRGAPARVVAVREISPHEFGTLTKEAPKP